MNFLKLLGVSSGFAVIDLIWRRVFKLPRQAEGWRFYLDGLPDFVFGIVIAKLFL